VVSPVFHFLDVPRLSAELQPFNLEGFLVLILGGVEVLEKDALDIDVGVAVLSLVGSDDFEVVQARVSDLVDRALLIRGISVCVFFVEVNVVHQNFDTNAPSLLLVHFELARVLGRDEGLEALALGDAVQPVVLNGEDIPLVVAL
jgi:hypothetical protein